MAQEPETGTIRTVFPETGGTGTVGTVFQEPKQEPSLGVRKRVVSKRVVLVDVPWTPKTGTRAQKTERLHGKPEQSLFVKTEKKQKNLFQ